jgi:type IV secretory pathway VirD2 relaxase
VDDPFEPKLGRIRSSPAKRSKRYLGQVLAAFVASGKGRGLRSRRFDGSRIGRAAGLGRLLRSRDRFAGFRSRRAVVKTRLVRMGAKANAAARAHLRYVQRDGVQRDGSPGQLYSADEDAADGKAFLERCHGDRHQFRLIVSAEDGAEYDDLKPLIRRFMRQVEEDLGTRLEWVAVDHRDTAQPHTHIILRGRDEHGQNLVISREYISSGMRERIADLVTIDLGPRQDHEIERMLRRDVAAERVTATDRALLRELDADGTVSAGHRDTFRHSLRAGRLKKLEALGLAEPVDGGRWKLTHDLEQQLRRLGERGDIIRAMQRELGAKGIERAATDRVIHGGTIPPGGIVGRLVARGLSDELADRHCLIVDGVDGRVHHVDIGAGNAVEPLPENCIVRLEQTRAELRSADRLVATIAEWNGSIYSASLHFRHDPRASEEFVAAHVRRLEAFRRAGRQVERLPDGSWRLSADHLKEAATYERQRASAAPVRVEILSPLPLGRLPDHEGATWLDRELVANEPQPLRDSGFGREVRSALALRRQWLLSQELAEEAEGEFRWRSGMLAALRQRELSAAATQLSDELGIPFAAVEPGQRIEGVVRRRIDLASGRYALIENSREFTLAPWRSVLERHIGKQVSGVVRGDGMTWTIGRGRSIEL